MSRLSDGLETVQKIEKESENADKLFTLGDWKEEAFNVTGEIRMGNCW